MGKRRERAKKKIIFGVILLAAAGGLHLWSKRAPEVASFNECAKAGYPVMESYPRQCRTAKGKVFREDIGNELEKDGLIRIETPRPNALVANPLKVSGMARGGWFFEASFPVRLLDGNGELLSRGIATTKSDWMTDEFAQFEAELPFVAPSTAVGVLFLDKDNPSGLPENADALRIPVRFR